MSDDLRFERRMSDQDALMWAIEKDPLLRSTITAVSIFDGPLDRVRFEERLERGTRLIPRLRQRAVAPPFAVAPPTWVVDRHFDLSYHLRWVRAAGAGTLRSALDIAEPIGMQSFDRARPLWEFTVVEGLEENRSALIQKIHHSVTDGVGAVKLAMMLLDLERDPTPDTSPLPAAPEPEDVSPYRLLAEGLQHERRRQVGILRRALGQARNTAGSPARTALAGLAGAASLARMLAPAFQPLSPIMQARSLVVRFDTVLASLPDMKAAARRADGRLNDAFVAAALGGLKRYHDHHGASAEMLRMSMPINIRGEGGDEVAGNSFVPARFQVPLNIDDPVERMRAVKDLVKSAREEPALAATEPIAGILNRLPVGITTQIFGSMLKGIDFVTSNVPGAPIPVYIAGAKLEAQYPFGPLAGAATNLTLLSYLDELQIGLNMDRAAIPDPDTFGACMRDGFDEIAKVA